MSRLWSIAIFGALSILAHGALAVLVWAYLGASENIDRAGSGAGGLAQITLQTPPADLAQLLSAWQNPPRLSQDSPALPQTAPAPLPPQIPNLETPQTRADPPQRSTPPAAAQIAEGAGGRDTGAGAAPETATGQGDDPQATATLLGAWGGAILRHIDRAPRPPIRARGLVTLRLDLARDGRLRAVAILASSGNAELDAAALNLLRAQAPYPPAPAEFGAEGHRFDLPIRFR